MAIEEYSDEDNYDGSPKYNSVHARLYREAAKREKERRKSFPDFPFQPKITDYAKGYERGNSSPFKRLYDDRERHGKSTIDPKDGCTFKPKTNDYPSNRPSSPQALFSRLYSDGEKLRKKRSQSPHPPPFKPNINSIPTAPATAQVHQRLYEKALATIAQKNRAPPADPLPSFQPHINPSSVTSRWWMTPPKPRPTLNTTSEPVSPEQPNPSPERNVPTPVPLITHDGPNHITIDLSNNNTSTYITPHISNSTQTQHSTQHSTRTQSPIKQHHLDNNTHHKYLDSHNPRYISPNKTKPTPTATTTSHTRNNNTTNETNKQHTTTTTTTTTHSQLYSSTNHQPIPIPIHITNSNPHPKPPHIQQYSIISYEALSPAKPKHIPTVHHSERTRSRSAPHIRPWAPPASPLIDMLVDIPSIKPELPKPNTNLGRSHSLSSTNTRSSHNIRAPSNRSVAKESWWEQYVI